MALTDTAIRNAKPRAKPYKLADGAGLYLEVMPTGARYWRFRYRIAGKDTRLAFGVYPEVTLAEARARRDDARRLLREGGDPAGERRSARLTAKLAAGTTFEGVARAWLATQKRKLNPATYDKAERILQRSAEDTSELQALMSS